MESLKGDRGEEASLIAMIVMILIIFPVIHTLVEGTYPRHRTLLGFPLLNFNHSEEPALASQSHPRILALETDLCSKYTPSP